MLAEQLDQIEWKFVFASAFSALNWLVGGVNATFIALAMLYLMDFALGFSTAWCAKKLSRTRFVGGIKKGLFYCLVIIASHMVDLVLSQAFGMEIRATRNFLLLFLGAGEFLSIASHLASRGVRLPKGLLDRLRSYRDNPEQAVGPFAGQAYGSIPGTPGQPPQPGQPRPSDFDDGGVR